MTKVSVKRTLADAVAILKVWQDNPDFTLGNLTRADFEAAVQQLQATVAALAAKRLEVVKLQDDRDDQAKALSGLTTRVRSGVRAVYGPDSLQYEQVGGVRASERKRPSRPAA